MPDSNCEYRVGVISDTHGLMRPEALTAFQGVSLIIHAGDIGTQEVLRQLSSVAPVVAVRGNTDQDYWACELSLTEVVEIGTVSLYVLHNAGELDLDPGASGFSAVISGHSHRPLKEKRNGVFFLNPGSAGPKRSKLPVSVAILSIKDKSVDARIIGL
ncbi:MAG: metallophosphoesterase family protein [Dissulfurispiraceae bacterium]|jgi:putative phosphoesterase